MSVTSLPFGSSRWARQPDHSPVSDVPGGPTLRVNPFAMGIEEEAVDWGDAASGSQPSSPQAPTPASAPAHPRPPRSEQWLTTLSKAFTRVLHHQVVKLNIPMQQDGFARLEEVLAATPVAHLEAPFGRMGPGARTVP